MKGVLDGLLVGLALFASIIYAAFSLGPRTLRPRLLAGASALLRRLPGFPGLHDVAARLNAAAAAAAAKAKGACGGCDNCGPEQAPAARSPASEVRIPLAKIGKR
jgi:hypothetical protein